jgi:hypothetical protein
MRRLETQLPRLLPKSSSVQAGRVPYKKAELFKAVQDDSLENGVWGKPYPAGSSTTIRCSLTERFMPVNAIHRDGVN